MTRLLNPSPEAGGGGATPAPAPLPAATATIPPVAAVAAPPGPASPPAQPPMIQLTPDQYQRLVETDREMGRLRAEQEQKVREAERKAAEAIGEKDGAKAALDRQGEDFGRERTAYLQEIRETKAESAMNAALAGIDFADAEALSQARAILAPRVVVEKDQSGRYVALDAESRRPAADVLREVAAGPSFARFRKAQHQGGGGGGNTPPAVPNPANTGLSPVLQGLMSAKGLGGGQGGNAFARVPPALPPSVRNN